MKSTIKFGKENNAPPTGNSVKTFLTMISNDTGDNGGRGTTDH